MGEVPHRTAVGGATPLQDNLSLTTCLSGCRLHMADVLAAPLPDAVSNGRGELVGKESRLTCLECMLLCATLSPGTGPGMANKKPMP